MFCRLGALQVPEKDLRKSAKIAAFLTEKPLSLHNTHKPERVLIIAPSWIGDAVMMQALLIRLKTNNPACLIDVFANA